MNEEILSAFGAWDYVHKATLVCTSCSGQGWFGDLMCGVCMGEGNYIVGCGSPAAIDVQHPALGGACSGCDHQVPLEEVSKMVIA